MLTTKKAIIKPYGFLGDHLFATSIARRLKQDYQYDVVDFVCGIPQLMQLLPNDPYIDTIFQTSTPTSFTGAVHSLREYSVEIHIPPTSKRLPPPFQFQQEAGIENPDTKFYVYTDPKMDEFVKSTAGEYIAVMHPSTWEEKAFSFTVDEYKAGVNVPYLGYGGKLRNINGIIQKLYDRNYKILYVGLPKNINSLNASRSNLEQKDSLALHASVIKHAKYFIGAEGGFANLACAVGTKTILTGEFVHQLYGWNGVIEKIVDPKLGPRFYFPEAGHIDLNPYYTDDEVASNICDIIDGKKTASDYTYEWVQPDYENSNMPIRALQNV